MSSKNGCIEVIIKLGGCAITQKDQFETENTAAIEKAAQIVKKLQGRCLVVHGAGSFGHFQAHEYGISKGFGNNPEKGRIGFTKTRLSVTKLNHRVTEMFVIQGIPAVGISTCGSWSTSTGHVTKADIYQVKDLLTSGFVPVLHGDCVIDSQQGCAILSGDKIIEKLVEELRPQRVVFLTNVKGIYDRPPENDGAVLLEEINVNENGSILVPISTSAHSHDVTGGLQGKLQSSVDIIINSKGFTKILVADIMSECAVKSCIEGCTLPGEGTVIKLSQHR